MQRDWCTKKSVPLQLGTLNQKNKRPLVFEVPFHPKSRIAKFEGGATGGDIISCSLEYEELVVRGDSPRPFAFSGRDIKVFPSSFDCAAGVEAECNVLESLQGCIKEYRVYNLSDNDQKDEEADRDANTQLDSMEFIIDGESLVKYESAAELKQDAIRRAEDHDLTANKIWFSRFPKEDLADAYLHTDGCKRLTLRFTSPVDSTAHVVAVVEFVPPVVHDVEQRPRRVRVRHDVARVRLDRLVQLQERVQPDHAHVRAEQQRPGDGGRRVRDLSMERQSNTRE